MPPETLLFAGPGSLLVSICAALFGLLIGSFLNVVIYRIPKMNQREFDNYIAEESGKPLPHQDRFNLMVPRSACPCCGHQITALENIPVVSYIALGGKCSACKAHISLRYPAIELVSGVLSGLLVWHFGSGSMGLATLVFGYLLLAMTFIDLDTMQLPDDMTLPLMWIGLLINTQAMFVPLEEAVIGAALGYLALWSVYQLFKLATGKEGMGYGDFKLLAALGAWFGWTMLPTIILVSSILGAIVGVTQILLGKHSFGKHMPFGPYLAVAGLVALFYGRPIAQFTQGFLG